ncbi:hypothetical protein M434DRAFT_399106 [Hypoxylon sp. CO27-5]|nr:hypothetical protein M434DRAFT_399106 [Hypoxylon sp. CO27-5]
MMTPFCLRLLCCCRLVLPGTKTSPFQAGSGMRPHLSPNGYAESYTHIAAYSIQQHTTYNVLLLLLLLEKP